VRAAAVEIHRLGASAVVVTGGHASGDDIVDLLFDGAMFTELQVTRIHTPHTHGTGCTFASAIAANLALGHSVIDAVVRGQAYVTGAIEHALSIGQGHGPLNHFWRIGSWRNPFILVLCLSFWRLARIDSSSAG